MASELAMVLILLGLPAKTCCLIFSACTERLYNVFKDPHVAAEPATALLLMEPFFRYSVSPLTISWVLVEPL